MYNAEYLEAYYAAMFSEASFTDAVEAHGADRYDAARDNAQMAEVRAAHRAVLFELHAQTDRARAV